MQLESAAYLQNLLPCPSGEIKRQELQSMATKDFLKSIKRFVFGFQYESHKCNQLAGFLLRYQKQINTINLDLYLATGS